MSEPFLSDDEVQALIERTEDGAAVVAATTAAPRGEVRPYDLTQQERIVRGRMPTLELVHDRFARNLRTGLFNFMRRSPDISVGPVKVEKYSAFLRDIVVPSNINIVQVRPLRGSGLLICEPQLVFGIIDSMFGGDGSLPSEFDGRDFSATEQRIIQRTIEVVCTEYRKAWVGVYPLELEYLRSERHPQYASIATPSEIVVSVRFDITIGAARGALHLCLPYATLEPIRETLYSSLQGDSSTIDRRWVHKLSRQLETAEIELVADLAQARATVADLIALEIGDFIELELERTLTAKVDGVPLLDCRYGVSNGRYALKLERFATNTQETPNGASDGPG
ncbi:MAG TPA: flagellar motor switch protein FliM [Burkholderiaceae bacterium]|nr:flagellar motor switch protein FliM [Burkholderiaceae bacterium]